METDPKLLEILVCPVTRTTLKFDRERQELISRAREVIDNDERARLYNEALKVYDDEQPWISMAHPKMFTAIAAVVPSGITASQLAWALPQVASSAASEG